MKRNLLTVITTIVGIIMCVTLTACIYDTTLKELVSEQGIVVEGGGFEIGSTLVTEEITSSEKIEKVKKLLEGQSYNVDKEIYVYDILVIKDGVEVQPNGKVTVTIPVVKEDANEYVVFHIKKDNSVEELVPSIVDDKIVFETESFSYFVIAETNKYTLTVGQIGSGGSVSINKEAPQSFESQSYVEEFLEGEQITLVANPRSDDYRFIGWFEIDDTVHTHVALKDVPVTTERTYAFTMGSANYNIYAVFEEVVNGLRLDGSNAGFIDGKAVYVVGTENKPNPNEVLVFATKVSDQNGILLEIDDYTIDLGGLDFDTVGTYTITYTYIENTSIKATLEVEVVEPAAETINLTYEGSTFASKYNGGRAAYVFKSDIKNNGESCDIESLGLSYEWRIHDTQEVVEAARDDTWDSSDPHFPSPAVVGVYDFVVYQIVEEVKIEYLVVTKEIIENEFEVISDASSLSEYTCYTFIAKVGSDYYAMSNPFTGDSEREAIKVVPNENGIIPLGNNYEYVFRPYDYYKISSDGQTLWGCRTGNGGNRIGSLILWSSGRIEYSTSTIADYTLTISINEDGTAKIHNPFCGGTLRLVYDSESQKYMFTAKPENDDTRTSYPVYLYGEYTEPAPTGVYEFYGKLSKEYDGTPVSFNIYKEVYVLTENGESLDDLLKYEMGRLVWTDAKGQVLMVATSDEFGMVEGPSEIGAYCLVLQTMQKGETGMEWIEKALLHCFEITNPSEIN